MNEHEKTSTGEGEHRQAARGRSGRRGRLPRAARFATGAVLAAGVGATGVAAAGAVTGSGGATGSLANLTSATTGSPLPSATTDPGGPVIWRGRHRGGPGFPGIGRGLTGTIASVSAGSISLTTPNGASVTVTLTSSTAYRERTATISVSDLQVGEDVVVVPTAATAGSSSPSAATVVVVGPHIAGRVVSVSGSDIVVADPQGFYRTVVTSSSTTVTEAGATSSLNALLPGTTIDALGTIAADHTDLDATSIRIVLPHVAGRVTAVDTTTGTLTVTTRGTTGTTTITTTAATRFRRGTSTTTLSAIPIGSLVVAAGTPGTGSTFAAVQVSVLTRGSRNGTGPGGGFGGPGPGLGLGLGLG